MIREFGQFNKQIDKSLSDFKGNIITGRVTNIYLTDTNDEDLGCIEIKSVSSKTNTTQKAYPFFPNLTSYPLIDEIVLCFNLPSQYIGSQQANEKLYYINAINIWNNNHVNFYPDPEATNGNIPASENKSYKQIFGGSPINASATQTNYVPGVQGTFRERDNIYPLQPYMGDVINQGRFGNSIRFGSTNIRPDNNKGINNWSEIGQTGDPILILRNGQPTSSFLLPENSWDPITENINNEQSSIYLTSTQKIPIKASNTTYSSYESEKDTPTIPSSYTGNQVIISSGRLLFNSNLDHILLSSQKTISFGAQKGFNFDTKSNFIVSVGTNIKLGGKEATESLILGDKFLENLKILLSDISALCIEISKIQDWKTAGPYPVVPTPANNGELARIANKVKTQIEGNGTGFIDRIDTYKSNVSKTL